MAEVKIDLPRKQLESFCKRWQIVEVALFGSALRENFNAESDLDILVTFAPEASWSLLDHIRMEQDLVALFHRPIDLFTRRSVERDHNWLRRQEMLSTAETIYATR
jgi:predicted nucleotidyltransferase